MRPGKHNKMHRTAGQWKGLQLRSFPDEPPLVLAQAIVNGGVDLDTDPADIEPNMLVDAKNVRCRRNKTYKRYGCVSFGPTKPNNNAVIAYNTMKRFNGTLEAHRFTSSTIYKQNSASWTAVTGAALGGSDTDRFTVLAIADRLFFANNGILALQEINLAANTYAAAGNAVKYKYYTTIGTRIVGANLAGPTANPIQIGWCGDAVYTQWDNSLDITAGNVNLIDTAGGFGDEITGIENVGGILCVLRQKSIWYGIPQPSGTVPFNWQNVTSGIGCSVPYSVAVGNNSVFWYDQALATFYRLKSGGQPEDIGWKIGRQVLNQIESTGQCFSGYDAVENEYFFGMYYTASSLVKIWYFNEKTNAWTYDEKTGTRCVHPLSTTDLSVSWDSLPGSFDSVSGTWDSMSPNIIRPTIIYGNSDGTLAEEDSTLGTDLGVNVSSCIVSKTFTYNIDDIGVNEVRIGYIPRTAGSFTVYFSVDAGLTWIAYTTISFLGSDAGKRKIARFMKHVRTRNFSWKLESSSGLFEITEFAVRGFPSGIAYD